MNKTTLIKLIKKINPEIAISKCSKKQLLEIYLELKNPTKKLSSWDRAALARGVKNDAERRSLQKKLWCEPPSSAHAELPTPYRDAYKKTNRVFSLDLSQDALEDAYMAKTNRRGKDYCYAALIFADNDHLHHEDGETEWRGRKPIAYTRATNMHIVAIYGQLDSERDLSIWHQKKLVKSYRLKPGYRFSIDSSDLVVSDHPAYTSDLVVLDRRGRDYHPTYSEIMSGKCEENHIKYSRLRIKNLRMERKEKIRSKVFEAYGTVVFKNSLQAGNCERGTKLWILKNIPGKEFAPVSFLQKFNDPRVKSAIFKAYQDFKKYWAEGYPIDYMLT